MIEYERALSLVLRNAFPLQTERVAVKAANHSVLARVVRARSDLPRFDQSAVDGYGVQAREVSSVSESSPRALRLEGMVPAGGRIGRSRLGRGCAVKILTGGRIPPGVDGVVMKEFCREDGGVVEVLRPVVAGENIRRRGEEIRRGACVLEAGTRITPPVAGVLSTFGITQVTVHRRPRVTVVSTGNELVAPGRKPGDGQIFDSNSSTLAAALRELGIRPIRVCRARDERRALYKTLERALAESDVVVTAGGISVGDYDFVREVLESLGVETVFWRVAMKPGKPNYFGIHGWTRRGGRRVPRRLVFSLPGNPVAVLVSFHQLVKPALLQLLGVRRSEPRVLAAELTRSLFKKAGRLEWVRGRLAGRNGKQHVTPTRGQGSHMLTGLAGADCLILFPKEESRIEKGQEVRVTLLEWKA